MSSGTQNSIDAATRRELHQSGAGAQKVHDGCKAKGTVCAGGEGLEVHCVHVLACQQACQSGRIQGRGGTCSRIILSGLEPGIFPSSLAAHTS